MGRRKKGRVVIVMPTPQPVADVPEIAPEARERIQAETYHQRIADLMDDRVDLKIAINTDGLTLEDLLINGLNECEKNGYAVATIVLGPSGTSPQLLGNCKQEHMRTLFAVGCAMIQKGTVIEETVHNGREN